MDKAGIIEKTLRDMRQFAPANEPYGDERAKPSLAHSNLAKREDVLRDRLFVLQGPA
jgi:hypothetical protein